MRSNTLQTDEMLTSLISKELDDFKVAEIKSYNLKGKLSYADFIIIGTVNSETHARASIDKIQRLLKKNGGSLLNYQKGNSVSGWNVVDAGNIVIHFFLEESRNYYRLDEIFDSMKIL